MDPPPSAPLEQPDTATTESGTDATSRTQTLTDDTHVEDTLVDTSGQPSEPEAVPVPVEEEAEQAQEGCGDGRYDEAAQEYHLFARRDYQEGEQVGGRVNSCSLYPHTQFNSCAVTEGSCAQGQRQ